MVVSGVSEYKVGEVAVRQNVVKMTSAPVLGCKSFYYLLYGR